MGRTDSLHLLPKESENGFKKKNPTDDIHREVYLLSFKAMDEISSIMPLTY